MTLEPGQTLAHYRLVEKIGEGGMGVIWKADDTKLGRQVAIKILPEEFARDKERLARFEREAKLLAALNHPNIAAIHGFEADGGVHFLVLELVPGSSLAEALRAGSLPMEEALDVGRQVAEGLEAAHEAGVIHRDLKPGNVRVTPDGKVKILDFGLAKELGPGAEESGTSLSHSPTITVGGTQAGVVLGTAPYMSPEQARGKRLDKRTDIWSFGCLLYEGLTGRMAFTGGTVADIISSILQGEPDWRVLPERTPARIRELLERCLEKSPRSRLHDVADARIELEKSLTAREWTTSGIRAAAVARPARRPSWRAVALLVAGLLVGAVATGIFLTRLSPEPPVSRFSIDAPDGRRIFGPPWISPDGRAIAYMGAENSDTDSAWTRRLYIRLMDTYGQTPVEGSENIETEARPSFSPDGRWLAFVAPVTPGSARRHLVKVPVDGSAPPLSIADWPENMHPTILWLPDGHFLGATHVPHFLIRFRPDGSMPGTPVEVHGVEQAIDLRLLAALPDGRRILAGGWRYKERGGQYDVHTIDTRTGESRLLIENAEYAAWSPTGHLLFTRSDDLLAVPFDPESLERTGGPVTISGGIWTAGADHSGVFGLSSSGTLVYRPGGIANRTRWLALADRSGRVEAWSDDLRPFSDYSRPAVSPDGRRLAVVISNLEGGMYEIWVSEVARPRLRPLASAPGADFLQPVWTPDSERVAYMLWGPADERGVYIRRFDATDEPQLLLKLESEGVYRWPTSVSPDGTTLLLDRQSRGTSSIELLPMAAGPDGTRAPAALLEGEPNARDARFSPDGRWIAYTSEETGRAEVYLRRFGRDGELGPRTMISDGGGSDPSWSKGGREGRWELLYVDPRYSLMAVSITTEPELAASRPHTVLGLDAGLLRADVMPDGRFLAIAESEEEQTTRINIVLNFDEEIRRKLAEAQ